MINRIKAGIQKYEKLSTAARTAMWIMICTVLQKGVSILTLPVFARIMTTTQYGQFTVYHSWQNILIIITTLRLNYAVFSKGMSKYSEDRDSYTCTMQLVTAAIAVICFAVYFLFNGFFTDLIGLPRLIISAMFLELIVTPSISFWTIRKRYEFIYRPIVIRTLLMLFLNAALGIVVVLLSTEKGYARILSAIAVHSFFGIMLFAVNLKAAKTKFVWEYAKFALLFNIPLIIHYLSLYVLDQFDKIMVQKMVSVEATAIYGMAYSAGMIVKIITQSLHQTMVPWQYNKLKRQQYTEIDNNLFLMLLAVSAAMICFSLCAPELMLLLGGKKYAEARFLIAPVALGMVFSFAFSFFASIEFYFDKNRFTMYISMIAAGLNVLLNYIGIKMYGYSAAAWTTAICYLVMSIGHYIYMERSLKKDGVDLQLKTKRLILMTVLISISTVGIVLLYPFVWIRYALFALSVIILFIYRKRLISAFKVMREAKRRPTEIETEQISQ